MKKRKYALLFFIFFCSTVQQASWAQVSMGPYLSFNSSSGAEEVGFSHSGALALGIKLRDQFYLQTGVHYIRRNLGFDLFSDIGNTWEIRSFNIPITTRLDSDVTKEFGFYALGGAAFGLVYKSESYYLDDRQEPIYTGEDFKSVEFSLVLGGGVKLTGERTSWFLGVQLNQGLNDLTRDENFNLVLRSFDYFQAGVLFPIAGSNWWVYVFILFADVEHDKWLINSLND